MLKTSVDSPQSWLAFELNILRRLKFNSVAMPYTQNPRLGMYLKHWDVRVLANDILQSAFAKTTANIENNGETLSPEEIEIILEDAYVPQYQLKNVGLTSWFNETDSWWFDNVRQNIQKISSPIKKAIALNIGMNVGDYTLSFDEETRELRQPLSNVFRKFWNIQNKPINNGQNNTCQNKNPNEFTAENYTDLLFLTLPEAQNQNIKKSLGWKAWQEEWVRGNDSFWADLDAVQHGTLGTKIETKSQYLNLLEDIFITAKHIDQWAIEHIENGFIQTQEIVDTIAKVRNVDTIYSKDFSELLGTKAVIITA